MKVEKLEGRLVANPAMCDDHQLSDDDGDHVEAAAEFKHGNSERSRMKVEKLREAAVATSRMLLLSQLTFHLSLHSVPITLSWLSS